jgi:hypothetical protein
MTQRQKPLSHPTMAEPMALAPAGPVEPTGPAAVVGAAVDDLPRVTVHQFQLATRQRADRLAGFAQWAARDGVSRLTIPQWYALHARFTATAV